MFAVAAVYCGGKVAMSFGRDLRKNLFHQVTDFSAREVGTFGAPSLITRITNDVQQVQMLVVMACTMAVAAPITMVVGVILALRQDVGLSIILVIAMPVAAIVLGLIVSRMVPAFRLMQERIDQVNRVLREQITGIRVVRAFVREPQEAQRFGEANDDLTEVSLRAGRLMSSMFPTVNFLINVSSVGVLWLGASRVNSGQIQVGTLVAYLTYLVQILMSVVMATFMISMIPRASVSADRIQEVLDTDPSVVPPVDPVREVVDARRARVPRRRLPLPGRRAPGARATSRSRPRPGQTTAIVGSTGAGKTTLVNLILRLFDSTEGNGARRRRRRARPRPRRAVEHDRPRAAAAVPVLGHGREQPAVRQARRHRGRDVGRRSRSRRPADFVRGDARRARTPASSRAAPTCRAASASGSRSPGRSIRKPDIYVFDDSFSALDLATDARLRAALGPYTRDAAVVIVAQRVSTISTADNILVLEDGVVDRARHARRAACATTRPTPRSCSRRSARRARGMTLVDDHAEQDEDEELDLSAPETRAAGPLELGRRSRRAVEGLQERGAPPGRGCSARCGSCSASSCVVAIASATLNVFGPAGARPRHRHHRQGRHDRHRHRLRRAAPRAVPGGRRSTRRRRCLSIIAAYMLAGVIQRLMFKLRSDVEDKVNALPLSYIDKQSRGDLLSRVTNDIDNVAQSLQQTLSQMLTSVLLLIGTAIMMFTISPLLAVVALTTVPVSVWGMRAIARAGPARSSSRSGRAPACSTRRSRRRSPATRS